MTVWRLSGGLELSFPPSLAAGVVNVTADSFYSGARSVTPEQAVEDGLRLVEAGFDLLDVGAVAARSGPPVEASAEIEMESLRPYREGAPASRIHWPTVARVGTLMERRLLADSDSQPLVVVDSTEPADEAALDKAVRAAASLCVHLARKGGCSVLLPGDRRAVDLGADLAGWPALHARLALVEPVTGAPAASGPPAGGPRCA